MKVINFKDKKVKLNLLYDELSLVVSVLGVPNHAFDAPDFETKIGVSQSLVDELGDALSLKLGKMKDYPEYHELALKPNSVEQTKKFSLDIDLSKDDIILLAKAFKEASQFIREKDDFHTMTGYDWEDAVVLQKELSNIKEEIKN